MIAEGNAIKGNIKSSIYNRDESIYVPSLIIPFIYNIFFSKVA